MTAIWQDEEQELDPYIVFTDLATNLVLILVFFLAAMTVVGQLGSEQVRYREAQADVRRAVELALPPSLRPVENQVRNDPPGVQRWVFDNRLLFMPGSSNLSTVGEEILLAFANVLRDNGAWRRIRIEGHTLPTLSGEEDAWEASTIRPAAVARFFTHDGAIEPWFLAVAGRAGQNPLDPGNPASPANERIEILLEYSHGQSFGAVRMDGASDAEPFDSATIVPGMLLIP